MGMVANKKTIYLMKLMGFRASAYNGNSGSAGHRLTIACDLPNHRRCRDEFI
jgi:hypothetical protein